MKTVELLAPAKNLSTGKTAILSGADAIYIGPEKFGARLKAGNSLQDIRDLIAFADQYYVKVYATINTLLFDDEIPPAVELIHQLNDVGISGIIIQDMGLLESNLPPVPLIASTQSFCNTPEKAHFFEKLGFKRIILPRELSIDQIAAIRQAAPSIELEYFVHGALCVSYSGQCYMSYALGGRSGNRGNCAQPCRKKYSLFDEAGNIIKKNQHLLSIKDMKQSKNIGRLIKSGVNSFKIEGRLKDENYIKNIVAYYRKIIDKEIRTANRPSSGVTQQSFVPQPEKSFNRGFTDYFIDQKRNSIGSHETPKMRGELLGRVKQVKKDSFTLDRPVDINNGDGITFFRNGELAGTNINHVKKGRVYPAAMQGIQAGQKLYRNRDHQFLSSLNNATIERKIAIEMRVGKKGHQYFIEVADEDDNKARNYFTSGEIARKPDLARQNIHQALSKTGKTIFDCESIVINLSEIPFLKKSELNALRRKVLENLLKIRLHNVSRPKTKPAQRTIAYPEANLGFQGNVINQYARQFYQKHGVKTIEKGAELRLGLKGQKVMTTRYCLRYELNQCPAVHYAKDNSGWILQDDAGNQFRIKFQCHRCEMELYLI